MFSEDGSSSFLSELEQKTNQSIEDLNQKLDSMPPDERAAEINRIKSELDSYGVQYNQDDIIRKYVSLQKNAEQKLQS